MIIPNDIIQPESADSYVHRAYEKLAPATTSSALELRTPWVLDKQVRKQALQDTGKNGKVTLYKRDSLKRPSTFYNSGKRTFDILGSLIALIILSPIMIGIALLIKLSSKGPVIFTQERLTLDGKKFKMFKFRTMVVGAESLGNTWTQKNDSRIIPFGAILRKSRLDETPQFLNVLLGSMSIIGPRPERPDVALELTRRFPKFGQRLHAKGGMTGLAQVGIGYASTVEVYRKKLAFDILYIKKQSLLLDLIIAIRTVGVVLTGRGAW